MAMRLDFPDYPVKLMCQVWDVSRSGYYDWLRAKPSTRSQEVTRLNILITADPGDLGEPRCPLLTVHLTETGTVAKPLLTVL